MYRLLISHVSSAHFSLIDIDSGLSIRARASGSDGLLFPLGFLGRLETLADCLDHLAEPVEVQSVENDVAAQVCEGQPQRDELFAGEAHDIIMDRGGTLSHSCIGAIQGIDIDACGGWLVVEGLPDILVYPDGLVGSPYETAAEEHD